MITNYPIGLYARAEYFRVLKSVFTPEVKEFVISRINATIGNVKPVIVIDDTTKKGKCYIINEAFTDLEEITGLDAISLCRKVESTANWQINRTQIQKSTLEHNEKEKICRALEQTQYHHKELTLKDKSELGYGLQDTQDKLKYESALSDVSLTASLTDIKPKATETELKALDKLELETFKTRIEMLQEKYPVYADEIESQLKRRNIKPFVKPPQQIEEDR